MDGDLLLVTLVLARGELGCRAEVTPGQIALTGSGCLRPTPRPRVLLHVLWSHHARFTAFVLADLLCFSLVIFVEFERFILFVL